MACVAHVVGLLAGPVSHHIVVDRVREESGVGWENLAAQVRLSTAPMSLLPHVWPHASATRPASIPHPGLSRVGFYPAPAVNST